MLADLVRNEELRERAAAADKLEAENAELKAENAELKERIAELEARLEAENGNSQSVGDQP